MTLPSGTPADNNPPAPTPTQSPTSALPAGTGLESLSEEWQDYIRGLRSENASRRVALRDEQDNSAQLRARITQLEAQVANMTTSDQPQQNDPAQPAGDNNALIDRITQLEQQVIQERRARIAAALGLPEILANRLQGTTEEEIRADAQAVAEGIRPTTDEGADEPPADQPPGEPAAPDGTPGDNQPPIMVDGQPLQPTQQPGQAGQPPANTTPVPGGQSVGRTDEERRRDYFGGHQSSAFNGGGMTVTSKVVQQE